MVSTLLESHSRKHDAGLEGPPARKASTPVQGSGGEMQDDHLRPGSRQGSKMLVSCPPGGGDELIFLCRLQVVQVDVTDGVRMGLKLLPLLGL